MEDLVGGALLVSPHLVRGGVLGTAVLQQEGDAAQIFHLASTHYINTPSPVRLMPALCPPVRMAPGRVPAAAPGSGASSLSSGHQIKVTK